MEIKRDECDHLVFENHHQLIIDYRIFATTKALREKRTTSCYRGAKINDNNYSDFLFCGDCGSPMFAMNRQDIKDAYRCGEYHKRGLKACTSHHIRVDKLDEVVKEYVRKVKENSSAMLERLNGDLAREQEDIGETERSAEHLGSALVGLQETLETTCDELESDLLRRIEGLNNQITMAEDTRNTMSTPGRRWLLFSKEPVKRASEKGSPAARRASFTQHAHLPKIANIRPLYASTPG